MFNLDLEDLGVFRVPKIYVMDHSIRNMTSALVHDLQETVGLFLWECYHRQKILSPKKSVNYNLQIPSHIPLSGLSRAACLLCICLGHFSLFSARESHRLKCTYLHHPCRAAKRCRRSFKDGEHEPLACPQTLRESREQKNHFQNPHFPFIHPTGWLCCSGSSF